MPINLANARKYSLHSSLFILTFLTTTLAGVQWLNRDLLEISNFFLGLPYSISILAVLAAHEFGHYFAARYHGLDATLPYFIPVPPFLINPFGTMGAVIRIKSVWPSKKALFDIGIAGPIAGFVVSLFVLIYGFVTLPGKEYLFSIHPDYRFMAVLPAGGLTFGDSVLYWGLSKLFSIGAFVPPMNEIYHYPYLCVGWFGMFVTSLNLMPVGQLDGGHIFYALLGPRAQGKIARIFFALLIAMGIAGTLPLLGWNLYLGTPGWLLWAAILYFLVKLDHPAIYDEEPLSETRIMLGWLIFIVFILTFTPVPLME